MDWELRRGQWSVCHGPIKRLKPKQFDQGHTNVKTCVLESGETEPTGYVLYIHKYREIYFKELVQAIVEAS